MRSQLARRQRELDDGAQRLGWKIGLNVGAVQERLGIATPVVGYLTSATELPSGATVDLAGATGPALEAEIAIHIAGSVPAGDGSAITHAIAGLGPALELVDVDLPFDDVEAILARNIFHRGVVFGAPRESPVPVDTTVRIRCNGTEEAAAAPADDPAEVVRFVADYLAAHGAALEAGDRIIAGSLTRPLPVQPGDEVDVDFGELGSLALRFSGR